MKSIERLVLPLLLALCPVSAFAAKPANEPLLVKVVREVSLEAFPTYEVRNAAAASVKVTIESSLERPDGTVGRQAVGNYSLQAGETRSFPAYSATSKLQGEIALLRSVITIGDRAPETQSAIVGTPQPVARDGDYFIGMNCHLSRYSAEDQWKMLQMMKAAGVRSVRIEPGFREPQKDGSFLMDPRIEQAQLGAEAFGMNSLFALTFFNPTFNRSETKAAVAYGWAKALGDYYKGRVFDWQYGNETNSGWSAFGAAADMAAHHQAMALGSLAADARNIPATLGIAEAEPGYLRELFRNGLAPYVKAVTLHPYCGVPEAGVAKMEANRRVITDFGGAQPIWATEIGFQVDDKGGLNPTTQQLTLVNGFTLEQQADLLARLYVLSRAKGIERIYWYNMFGKNDRETFWLVDENFKPRQAYETLKFLSTYVNDATPLGGTESTEPVQRQLFRRGDGSVFLAAWALRDGTMTDLHLPPGQYTVYDSNGKKLDIDLQKPVALGERILFIDGLPKTTTGFSQLSIIANSLDGRPWGPSAINRWETEPGASVLVPCITFNSGTQAIKASAVLVSQMPGWKIELPEPFEVAPGQTVAKEIKLTAPADAVRGVEYRFSFALESEGPHRTLPYEARIWMKGAFPYTAYLATDTWPSGEYPVRRPIDEGKTGFGRPELTARRGTMTIDGDLTKWKPEEFVRLDQLGYWKLRDAKHPSREDWSVRAALRWDDQNLYIAFLVQDDDLSLLDLVSRDWRDADNVRLFLSAEGDAAKRSKLITERDLLVFLTPTRQFHNESCGVLAASLGGYVREGFESQVKTSSRVWYGGYLIEAAVPFSGINVKPTVGMTLGCNLMADDSDGGYRKSAGMTLLKNFDYWNSPTSLGNLRLLSEEQK